MKTSKESAPDIPLERVSRFVRQVTHDIRNGLNAVDLQATYLSEVAPNEECRNEACRLREIVANVTSMLQRLSGEFQEIGLTPMTCSARIFLEDAKARLDCEFGARMRSIRWSVNMDDAQIEIDLEAGFQTISELVRNALKYREEDAAVQVESKVRNQWMEVSVIEDKSAAPPNMETWGREPLLNIGGRGYGLGLFRVSRVMEKLNGSVRRTFDSRKRRLITTVAIPMCVHG